MITTALAGLIKIELPGAVTVRLCTGGVISWGAEIFKARDATFGALGSMEALGEGVGDEVPALEMVLIPDRSATAAALTVPGFQTSRTRFWIAEYSPATGAVVGTPDLIFNGQIDQLVFSVGRDTRELAVSVVALLERLFSMNIGNSLNPPWHKSVWPGETGHDNATGLSLTVAWGTQAPPRGPVGSASQYPAPTGIASWLLSVGRV